MTLKNFEKHMEAIKGIEESNKIFSDTMMKLDSDNWGSFIFTKPLVAMVELLKDAVDDKNALVDYFIWELDWGKNGKNCITEGKKKTSLCTYKQLYNAIKQYEEV